MGRCTKAQKEEYHYVRVVTKTDCSNPKGHSWEWIFGKKAEAVRKQIPSLTSCIVRCIYCKKYSHSM